MSRYEIRKYTPRFKKKILDELEKTNCSYTEISEKYNIGGSMTIKRWILASGRKNLLHPVKVIGVENEILR